MQVVILVLIIFVLVRKTETGLRILLLREGSLDGLIIGTMGLQFLTGHIILIAQERQQQMLRLCRLSLHGPCLQKHQLDDAACLLTQQWFTVIGVVHHPLIQRIFQMCQIHAHGAQNGSARRFRLA